MSTIIEIQGLTKKYGDLTALHDLSLNIEEGEVFGFIGPNGAGKTTTMRILTTLLKPTGGKAWVAGESVIDNPRAVRRNIGYMPDFFGVYDDMKVWEYLDFFAACYDIPPATRLGMIDDLLALVDLGHKKDAFVDSLSRGMKQRLCLARTLAHDPQVLILDEPASGLDPRARIEMRELLRELKLMGKTIFFSSHILSEVADICTSIAILEAGGLVAYGDMAEMKRQLRAHRLMQHNSHDFTICGHAADGRSQFGLVLDGCGSKYRTPGRVIPSHNEVGAKLLGQFAAGWLARCLPPAGAIPTPPWPDQLYAACLAFLDQLLAGLGLVGGPGRAEFIASHLLCTLLGFVISADEATQGVEILDQVLTAAGC